MSSIKDLDSTAIYAYTTLVSVIICVPAALIVEGPSLRAGIDKAVAHRPDFYLALLSVGFLYHLYNQVSHAAFLCLLMHQHQLICVDPALNRRTVHFSCADNMVFLSAHESPRHRCCNGAHLVPAVCLQHAFTCEPGVTRSLQCRQASGYHWNLCCLLRHYADAKDQDWCATLH